MNTLGRIAVGMMLAFAPFQPALVGQQSGASGGGAAAAGAAFPVDETTIAQLHAAYLARKATAREVTQAYLDRIAAYDKFYQNVYAGGPVTPDGVSVPLAAYNNGTTRTNLFSQTDLTALAATGRFRHTLLVGTEFGRQETDNLRLTGYFEPGVTSML